MTVKVFTNWSEAWGPALQSSLCVRQLRRPHNATPRLNDRHLLSRSSGGSKSRVKGTAGRVSGEASVLGWQRALRPHMAFSLCSCVESSLVSLPLLSAPILPGQGPTLTTSANLNQLPEKP